LFNTNLLFFIFKINFNYLIIMVTKLFKMFMLLMFFYNINVSDSYNLCVVGASSGLGREIIYQSLENNKNNKILALTKNPQKIKIPYRGTGLTYKDNNLLLRSANLEISTYYKFNNYNFSNVIFTTSAQPFEKDYSDILTQSILNSESLCLKNIILISAYGVGDSLSNSNAGIKIMNNLYLQDTYRAKNVQEDLLNSYKKDNPDCVTKIIRPKALSYGTNIYGAKSRERLANEILDFLDLYN